MCLDRGDGLVQWWNVFHGACIAHLPCTCGTDVLEHKLVVRNDGWAMCDADQRDADFGAALQALVLHVQVHRTCRFVHQAELGQVMEQACKAQPLQFYVCVFVLDDDFGMK